MILTGNDAHNNTNITNDTGFEMDTHGRPHSLVQTHNNISWETDPQLYCEVQAVFFVYEIAATPTK